MGSTGVWTVGAVPDQEAATLPEEFVHLVTDRDFQRPDGYADTLAWWSRDCDGERLFTRDEQDPTVLLPTAAGRRFADFVHDANPETAATEAMRDASLALMVGNGSDGLSSVVARKASPIAALYYGLGASVAGLLPGWFGDFLLTADGVCAALPHAERALRLDGERRAEVLERIAEWMTGMGDDPDFVAGDLLDAPLRVLRYAADAGLGVVAFTRWY
ncbi:hypothetical protein ACFZB9_36595 [Kitasatospora sp. NPDC008050]|uniref:hypothetical protein n=1 Tax=Kitasatospora sp. NPDC008050 TaxID=3364021 RepID=UPI0036E23131